MFALFQALVMAVCASVPTDLQAPHEVQAPPGLQAPPDRAAIEAYRAGDLASARSLWLEVLEAEDPALGARERGRVLYDLGNVAAREAEWLEAVGWYSASLRLRPRDADAWANLEYARLQAELPPADRGDLTDTLRRVVSSFTPAEGEWLALAGLLPLMVLLVLEAVRGGALWRRLAWVGLALAALSTAPFFYARASSGGDPLLVVDVEGAAVRSEPRADAKRVARADAGAQLERLDELPGWVRVRFPDGERGWTRQESVFALRR